jgi:formylglycine-generating enzyme required for sulfatase activity
VLERYTAVRRATESICEGLTPEDQMVQSMPDASPTKWHLAHTSWFFETFLLKPYLKDYRLFHDDFTFLFNSYYKQLGAHPNRSYRGLFSRPSSDQVLDYRRYVDDHMRHLISVATDDDVHSLVVTGLNHEQQHQELIVTDIKHGLWSNPLKPAWKNVGPKENVAQAFLPVQWLKFDGGLHSIGHHGPEFSFDNETPRHQVFVEKFQIASRPVTNREYLEFVNDGGYRRPELWLSDGWDAVNANHWTAPLYWEECRAGNLARREPGGSFCHSERSEEPLPAPDVFTVNGLQPLNPDEPVCHISYYEADAFARWAGCRLPSEAEWEIVASGQPIAGNFLESGLLHPCSASDLAGSSTSADTLVRESSFFGNVWQWTSSPYTAYPGFTPVEGALGEYNGKFMCNQFVLRGGSCATPQSHIRATYRNFFPPHARWQFMGLRLAK